ncbi:unnamed protein product [Anisakis simplex]|uniref:Lysophospholipid acyltransferase 7 n=1 Tax=Anisakis simplex TaxID=6269 RepID=A0A0M3JQR4_ANISI|nr:unnamed protein product [Anisakis simplex]
MSSTANSSMWTAVSYLIMERVDDLLYAELLMFSFMFSVVMRMISNGTIREICGALIGILMVYWFVGSKLLYSLIIVCANMVLFTYVKNRYLPLYSFLLTFTYLGLLRLIHLFGFPPLISHANAVQLFMTLRLVGLSFEIEDARRKNTIKCDPKRVRFIVEPNPWHTFLYAYNFAGLFTGPYYTYAMHRDTVDNDDIMDISVWSEIFWRLWNLAWSLPAFIILVYAFPLQTMRSDEFYDETIYYRIWVSGLVFFWMRCRVYSAWMVAESICVLNGIGVYPENCCARAGQGPTKLDSFKEEMNAPGTVYNSEAVRNLDIWSVEFAPSFRAGMRAWNRSVQYWLATYVYKRVSRDFGVFLTMLVSAYWHGVHPGYYLSFLTVPLCTFAEDQIVSIMPHDKNGNLPLTFTIFWYVIRQLGFTLMASGFLLLTWRDTIRYWNSVHYHVHWIMVTVIVFAWLYKTLLYAGIMFVTEKLASIFHFQTLKFFDYFSFVDVKTKRSRNTNRKETDSNSIKMRNHYKANDGGDSFKIASDSNTIVTGDDSGKVSVFVTSSLRLP